MITLARRYPPEEVTIWLIVHRQFRLAWKGSAKAFDQNAIIHVLWKHFIELGAAVWIERVPTAFNIADDPSREDLRVFDVLSERVAVQRVPAKLRDCYYQPETWEHVTAHGLFEQPRSVPPPISSVRDV